MNLRDVRLVATDVDGVLTDNTFVYGPDGEKYRRWNMADGQAVLMLRRVGVEVLFLKKGARAWGRFDRDLRGIELHEGHGEGNQDLLDLAAVQAVMHGGKVYVVDGEMMPVDEGPIAAVFRY